MQEAEIIVDNDLEPARRKISSGWIWILSAFALYRRAWLVWTVIALLVSIIFLAAAAIPVVGGLFASLLLPVLIGGVMQSAKQADEGVAPEVLSVFSGFAMSKDLLKVGLFYMSAMFAIVLLLLLFATVTIKMGWMPELTAELLQTRGLRAFWPFWLFFFSSFAVLYSAYFFAPTLVVLRKLSATDAMRLSFLGFWRNWKPIFLMGFIGFFIMLAATLPMMLGLLVAGPVMLLTSYTSYADIYEN